MDPQGSLMNWARIRAAGDIEVLASGAARLPALLATLERRGVTLVLLDTPGAEGAASSGAMQAADLNIVPSRPSLFDLWASARSRAALEEIGARFVFLLNRCPPAQQTARVQDGVEALGEMGESDLPADPCPGRLPGRGSPGPGRDRAQSIGRRRPGNARPLAVHRPPASAGQGWAARSRGGVSCVHDNRNLKPGL